MKEKRLTGAEGGRSSLRFSAPESGLEEERESGDSAKREVVGEEHWVLAVLTRSVGLSRATAILLVFVSSLVM